jgi:hypothetical protein
MIVTVLSSPGGSVPPSGCCGAWARGAEPHAAGRRLGPRDHNVAHRCLGGPWAAT